MRKLHDRLVGAKPPDEDRRPVLLAIAGPNGAGKTTFYHAFIEASGLRFLNPDLIAKELHLNTTAHAGRGCVSACMPSLATLMHRKRVS